jgi:hypothetical protein
VFHRPTPALPRTHFPSPKSTAERAIAAHAKGARWSEIAAEWRIPIRSLLSYVRASGHDLRTGWRFFL